MINFVSFGSFFFKFFFFLTREASPLVPAANTCISFIVYKRFRDSSDWANYLNMRGKLKSPYSDELKTY